MSLLQEMSVTTGLGLGELGRILATAPVRYKVFAIPKRDGGRRIIAQPSPELKIVQRALMSLRLERFPVHPAASAYVRGKSLLDNARVHVGNDYLLKLDFRQFFPSLAVRDWRALASRRSELLDDRSEVGIVSQALFWGKGGETPLCLSIGAPSSPLMSNLLMHDLDHRIANECSELFVSYSRYADDITLSAANAGLVLRAEVRIRKLLQLCRSPVLRINEEKRGLFTPAGRRMVTGLVLTPERQISIGRARKRKISALIHRYSLGQLSGEQIGEVKGLLGFAIAVEAAFVTSMRKKYGSEVVDSILKTELPRREVEILPARTRKARAGMSAQVSKILIEEMKKSGE